jgi:hypothetical protein
VSVTHADCGIMTGMTVERWARPWPDDRIWVRLKAGWTPEPDLRWRIDGNAHTHRGHFYVSAHEGKLTRTVNASDVVDASPEGLATGLGGMERGRSPILSPTTPKASQAGRGPAQFVRPAVIT